MVYKSLIEWSSYTPIPTYEIKPCPLFKRNLLYLIDF